MIRMMIMMISVHSLGEPVEPVEPSNKKTYAHPSGVVKCPILGKNWTSPEKVAIKKTINTDHGI